jgi:hypothetical protein
MKRYYDKDGRRIPPLEWRRLSNDKRYARVALDAVPDSAAAIADMFVSLVQERSVMVLTVWTGVAPADAIVLNDVPYGIFESRVMGGPDDGYTVRYRTRDEAEIGHATEVAIQRARYRARNS